LKHRNSTLTIILALALTFLMSCTIKDPLSNKSVAPLLSMLMAPESIFLQTDTAFPVSVKVTDPQGWQDIALVQAFIFPSDNDNSVFQDTLQDDGLLGDIIPRDGIFCGLIPTTHFNNVEGSYALAVVALDSDSNISDTLKTTITVYDDEKNQPPVLSQQAVPDTMNLPFLLNASLSIHAEDPQGLDDIDTVGFSIYLPYGVTPHFEDILLDNGQNGDAAPNDGSFSYQSDLSDTLTVSGMHTIRFWAFDKGGLQSNAMVQAFVVDRANDPPVIVQITAPDTVSRSPANAFPIYAEVYDPQSVHDIQIVYFIVTKPDGSSNNISLQMFDDGVTADDVTSNDGIYTLTVEIGTHNDLGTYRFDFTAKDLSGVTSETVSHFITVVDEL